MGQWRLAEYKVWTVIDAGTGEDLGIPKIIFVDEEAGEPVIRKHHFAPGSIRLVRIGAF